LLNRALRGQKRVVVPYCDGPDLRLFRLTSLDELSPGAYGIPEPRPELRDLPDRRIEPDWLDLVLVPGVAFDRKGGRLGQGAGYFDRFLPTVPAHVPRVGLAFACQLFPKIPMAPHDVRMDCVVAESGIFSRPKETETT
ncbi:MAG: 5-formyltetrahydrofolate cyclo-ligase, partial [Pirellulales bacterium]|nr:5-formyltetrahydrofolate cyclo-ligase [Pirellulales bacterium]